MEDVRRDERLLYVINDAAAQLSISRHTLYRLIAAGEVKAVKIGRRTLVPRSSLVGYVARLEVAALSETRPDR